jgi:hypothetical protein
MMHPDQAKGQGSAFEKRGPTEYLAEDSPEFAEFPPEREDELSGLPPRRRKLAEAHYRHPESCLDVPAAQAIRRERRQRKRQARSRIVTELDVQAMEPRRSQRGRSRAPKAGAFRRRRSDTRSSARSGDSGDDGGDGESGPGEPSPHEGVAA